MLAPLLITDITSMQDQVICTGVPFKESDIPCCHVKTLRSPNQTTEKQLRNTHTYHRGILAFLVGVFLAAFGWVSNQGWTILALMLFGPFDWALKTAWKHLLFCTIGSICTAVSWCVVFKWIFPEVYDDDDDCKSNKKKSSPIDYVTDALQELGELGFILGYLGSQYTGMQIFNKWNSDNTFDDSYSRAVDGSIMIMLIVWIFSTKVKDYMKAVKRVREMESIRCSDCECACERGHQVFSV